MAKLVRHLTCNEKIGGSNPSKSSWWLVRHVKKTTGPRGAIGQRIGLLIQRLRVQISSRVHFSAESYILIRV